MNLQRTCIPQLRSGYLHGESDPKSVIASIYERIRKEGERPVWISVVSEEQALQAVDALGPASVASRLPLFGVPFAVKDNMDVAGMTTTAGCPQFGYVAKSTAPVVQCLIDAGAILIGKTNMDQFATGLVGTRSPFGACSSVFNQDFVSGGSSSGSAVAVAKGLVSFALGTDTAGSGRVPAALNNLVGVKPTRGLLSTRNIVPACASLDCVSIFGSTVEDVRIVFQAARAFDADDPWSRRMPNPLPFGPRFRFGVPAPSQLNFFDDNEAASLFQQAATRFRLIGGEQIEIDLAPFLEAAQLLYAGPFVAERYAAVGAFVESQGEACDPTVREIILGAKKFSAVDAFRAIYRLAELKATTEQAWSAIDVLLLPTTPTAFTHAEIVESPVTRNSILGTYTNFVNLLDLAAVAVPAGFRTNGMPFGVSIIGRAFQDDALLRLAAEYESTANAELGKKISIAVVGAHLTGQPLNWQLTDRGARLVRTTKTSSEYRFYALAGTKPEKPGLIFEPGFEGPGIEIEIWEMPESEAGGFLKLVVAPLAIGTLRLDDGGLVQGFVCEAFATRVAREITHFGGWRAYRASLA